jgi:hypothetical protein
MPLLTGSFNNVSLGDYTVFNNDWDVPNTNLVIGTNFTQQISYNSNDLNSNVVMSWNYPEVQAPDFVYGYPEVIWGGQYGGIGPGTRAFATQVSNISSLVANYNVSISGETNKFDVGMEIWTTNGPPSQAGVAITNEIMVKVHGPTANGLTDGPGTTVSNAQLGISGGGTSIEVVHPVTEASGSAGTFVTIDTTSDVLSGQINFATILNSLVAEGIVNSNNYVSGVELGSEMLMGSGSLTVNNFSVTENSSPPVPVVAPLGPNAINDLITELYVGYYNRAPDPSGENYWVTQLAGGMSLSAIAQFYSVQTESAALYPFLANPNTSSTAAIDSFIAAIYQNLFGHAPDAAGQAYYVQRLQNGQNTVGGTIIAIESGAQGNDLLVLANKLTVGDYFDTQIFNNNVQFSQSVALAALAAVTANASSITTAEALVNTYVATAPHAAQAATGSQAAVNVVGVSPSHDLAIAA